MDVREKQEIWFDFFPALFRKVYFLYIKKCLCNLFQNPTTFWEIPVTNVHSSQTFWKKREGKNNNFLCGIFSEVIV